MKLGIGAVGLPSQADFRKAGTARYALQVVEHMARLEPESEFNVFVAHDFGRPEEWRADNIVLQPVTKYRLHWALSGWKARSLGCQAWFAPTYEIARGPWLPQVAMIHDLFPLTNPEWFSEPDLSRAREAIDRSCGKGKPLFANSEDTAQRIRARYPALKSPIRITPLGPGNLRPRTDRAPVERPYVLTLGTLEPRKNIPALIEGFALLRATHPELRLVVGGGKGWREGPIFDRVRELGLEDAVEFAGYVDDADLPRLFADAECFVMPSLAEGFGIPVLEAMHYGAPVACSDIGALAEVGGEIAVYFDPASPQRIAEGIERRLATDRREAVEAGFQRAERFTWERTAQLTLEAIRSDLQVR